MRLTATNGLVVDLSPLRYEFGRSPEPGEWDANWLVVAGRVHLPDGRAWTFTDPCLTTWEARELGAWLEGVRLRTVSVTAFGGGEDEPSLAFTEPSVAFSLADRNAGAVTVRIHLSLGSLPPWLREGEDLELFAFVVEVHLTDAALAEAEVAWARELAAFPVR